MQVAPSAYYERKRQEADLEQRSIRQKADEALRVAIRRIWGDNFQAYGVRQVWHQLTHEGIDTASCSIECLIRAMGLRGVVRSRTTRTAIAVDKDSRPLDLVQRRFRADPPNQLLLTDFSYVATWSGFVYVAFVVDVFSRMIVGWRLPTSMSADLTLGTALWAYKVKGELIHHSDRRSHYLSIRYTERSAEVGIVASVGSIGDAYDNAMEETINGLFKVEVIQRRGPWRNLEAVEHARLKWVHWFIQAACLSRSGILLLLSLRSRIIMGGVVRP